MSIFNILLKKLKKEEVKDEEQKEGELIVYNIIDQKKVKEDIYRERMARFLSLVKRIG